MRQAGKAALRPPTWLLYCDTIPCHEGRTACYIVHTEWLRLGCMGGEGGGRAMLDGSSSAHGTLRSV